ncbi:MAG TPA: shikimate kinase [Candidatus Brocadiaceae bacterium]
MNIILIGFRGTGKTSIGRILGRELDMKFTDADEYLEKREGKTIKDIFAEGGEKLFRDIEVQVIAELSLLNNTIIATGGGAVLRGENVRRLKKHGIMILLDADVDTVYKRISKDIHTQQRRPSLTNRDTYEEIEYLLAYRRPIYDRIADFVVETTHGSPREVARKIISFIRNHVMDLKN